MPSFARTSLVWAAAMTLVSSIAVGLVSVAPAQAAPTGAGRTHPIMLVPGERIQSDLTQYASYIWGGYADDNTSGNTYTSASGSWVEPSVKCNSEDRVTIFWVGLDGLTSNTVEQAGTYAQCFQGTASYYTWWEMYPTTNIQIVGTAKAGDHIAASVSFAGGKFTLKLTDSTTTAASFSTKQACGSSPKCSRSSADWIVERPSGATGVFPLAQFAPWKLTGASVTSGSTTGTIKTFPDDQVTMVDTTQTYPLATDSALNAAGNSFTATWKNSY